MTPKEARAEWVRMLRSGEYTQGKAWLHKTSNGRDYYCCLGVLCELAVREKLIPLPQSHGEEKHLIWKYDGNSTGLRQYIRDFVGMTYAQSGGLVHRNDALGETFSQIADAIEAFPDPTPKYPTPKLPTAA